MIACGSNIVVSTHTFFHIFPKVKEEFAGSSGHSTPQKEAGGSFYTPASDEESSSEEISFESKQRRVPHPGTRRDHLNAYLCSRDISPVRSQLQIPWQDASDRTKCYYVRKAGQGLSALVQDIAPTDAGSLYKAVRSSQSHGAHIKLSQRRQLDGHRGRDIDERPC